MLGKEIPDEGDNLERRKKIKYYEDAVLTVIEREKAFVRERNARAELAEKLNQTYREALELLKSMLPYYKRSQLFPNSPTTAGASSSRSSSVSTASQTDWDNDV